MKVGIQCVFGRDIFHLMYSLYIIYEHYELYLIPDKVEGTIMVFLERLKSDI